LRSVGFSVPGSLFTSLLNVLAAFAAWAHCPALTAAETWFTSLFS
jgi:hypothetical protein